MSLSRIHNISLKWKLLIPFLFLSSIGAMALFFVSYRFQAQLIHLNEKKHLSSQYHYFLDVVESKKRQMISLATMIARDPMVAKAFAARDRDYLMAHLEPAFRELKKSYGVRQLHFHVPPAVSFLRVHMPDRHGDDLTSYRKTINEARKKGEPVGGLEKGVAGFGLRGVVPVFFQGVQVGTVEVGSSFGKPFLNHFTDHLDAEVGLYVPGESEGSGPAVLASTGPDNGLSRALFDAVFTTDQVQFRTGKWADRNVAFVVGPVKNFSGETVAVTVIHVDRDRTLALLGKYRTTAVMVGLVGLILSISFVWFISVVFTNRIAKVVEAADQIASGHRDTRIEVKGADEIGIMANAINEMLHSLEESRRKIKDYAENLEHMVEERTAALEESEQSYRSLVEHVPLIVYFIMPDWTVVFLNEYVAHVIGTPAHQLTGHHEVWTAHIHPGDRARVLTELEAAFVKGEEFQGEYRMIHEDGHIVHVLDHAVPVFDETKQLMRMDGIVLDVTAQKELQEKIVQAEELETLGEVSARLAHEIRNPLTSIGGLTRRLVKSFGREDSRKRKGELIVEEVGRLERILEMMTAYIEPKSIQLRACDFNDVVSRAITTVNNEFGDDHFSVDAALDSEVGTIQLDCDLFEKILISLMKNGCFRMKRKGCIHVTTGQNGDNVNLTLAYALPFIADDDIDHFFYPFVVDYPFPKGAKGRDIMDVPICRVLIHKHGGIINVNKEDENMVKITIVLPKENG